MARPAWRDDVPPNTAFEDFVLTHQPHTEPDLTLRTVQRIRPPVPREAILLDALKKLIEYMTTTMYTHAPPLESVSTRHVSQMRTVITAISHLAALLGCRRVDQRDRLDRWMGASRSEKPAYVMLMPRATGKTHAISAILTFLICYLDRSGSDTENTQPTDILLVHMNLDFAILLLTAAQNFFTVYCEHLNKTRSTTANIPIRIERTQSILTIHFATFIVVVRVVVTSSIRSNHPAVIFMDEFLMQNEQTIRDAVFPILASGSSVASHTALHLALCFSTPCISTKGIIHECMTGRHPTCAVMYCTLVCDRRICNTSNHTRLRCPHRWGYVRPWQPMDALRDATPAAEMMTKLINSRCYVQGIADTDISKDITERLLEDTHPVTKTPDRNTINAACFELQILTVIVAIDPDFGHHFSKLGLTIAFAVIRPDKGLHYYIVCATSIESTLRNEHKQSTVYATLKAVWDLYHRALLTLDHLQVVVESNNAQYQMGILFDAINTFAKEKNIRVLVVKDRITRDILPYQSVTTNAILKSTMLSVSANMAREMRIHLTDPMLQVTGFDAATNTTSLEMKHVTLDLPLLEQLSQLSVRQTSRGVTISAKTKDASDDIIMSLFICLYAGFRLYSSIDPYHSLESTKTGMLHTVKGTYNLLWNAGKCPEADKRPRTE
jgi:hypothetical protein